MRTTLVLNGLIFIPQKLAISERIELKLIQLNHLNIRSEILGTIPKNFRKRPFFANEFISSL